MDPAPSTRFEVKLGLLLVLGLLAACALMLLPFLSAILWAVILSQASWPLYERLAKVVGGRRTVAALILALGLGLLVLVPFGLAGAKLAGNIDNLRATTERWKAEGLPAPPGWLSKVPAVGARATAYWQDLATDRSQLAVEIQRLLEPATRLLLRGGAALANGLVHLALSIFIAFFLFRHGAEVADRLGRIIGRIGGDRGRHLLKVAGDTVRGVVYGILGTAMIQAAMAAFGFILAGVPGVGLLTLLMFFFSIVPGGPPLVCLPAALWLFAQGSTGWGIFMVVWGLLVSSVDNFVRPWLISKGSELPFLLIFLGVVGGALTFGFIGVFLGPTLMSVAFRLIEEWSLAETPATP